MSALTENEKKPNPGDEGYLCPGGWGIPGARLNQGAVVWGERTLRVWCPYITRLGAYHPDTECLDPKWKPQERFRGTRMSELGDRGSKGIAQDFRRERISQMMAHFICPFFSICVSSHFF